MASCSVALLLISAKFLNSKFILGTKVPALLKRREQEGVRIIPVILKPCAWTRVGWLKSIQARPKDGKPLSGMSEHDADAAIAALAEEIAKLVRRAIPVATSPMSGTSSPRTRSTSPNSPPAPPTSSAGWLNSSCWMTPGPTLGTPRWWNWSPGRGRQDRAGQALAGPPQGGWLARGAAGVWLELLQPGHE